MYQVIIRQVKADYESRVIQKVMDIIDLFLLI